ncbi:splicing factor, Prp19-binding domain-containing protein [Lentinula aciculospora]|uniref:Splicing factor, Prp19-binding domain-containing protein n=1 Tax=Lentinula aciculospora TaxID=153920 RepID=A0A9W9AN50_9AGAR|nr:splicing factor, Prp19-binding domain-containing protein [Lentinula aciculospora]
MSNKPKQAPRMARPAARYWAGKAPKNVVEADSDTEEEEQPQMEEEGDVNIGGEQEILQEEDEDDDEDMPMNKELPQTKSMNIALRDVNISKEGKVIVAGREESGKTVFEEDEESEDESEEDIKPKVKQEESEEESSEYESDSEEEQKPKLQFRPVFVAKRNRETVAEREQMAQDTEEAVKRKEMELEERRKQSHDLVAESIKRELAEKEKEEQVPDVDDTDGLDPAGEFEAWRLRELARIKKEKEEEIRREQEREEIERRRAMPEEQRLKEDLERAQKLRDEKPKGQQKFLQKYWHKGAFHQDEEILKRHDFTEATESTTDVSLLPKVMQVKNFGKRSRTKYTHLLDQDTTIATGGFGGAAPVKSGGKSTEAGGCFLCGGPHMKKDCPQNVGPTTRQPGSGANATSGGSRQWGAPPRDSSSWRDRDDRENRKNGRDRPTQQDQESYSHGSRRSSRSPKRQARHESSRRSRSLRPMSGSRSPPHGRRERRRSRDWSEEHDSRDKRRREVHRHMCNFFKPTPLLPLLPGVPRETYHFNIMPRVVKVAVIGTGLSGLTAAYLLSGSSSEVEFEVHSSTLGMDSSSITLPVPGKEQEWRIDVPMRSFQSGYYNTLISLYNHLGISFRKTDFSYSFSRLIPEHGDTTRKIATEMIYNGNSGIAGVSTPSSMKMSGKMLSSIHAAAAEAYVFGIFTLMCIKMLILYIRVLFLSIPTFRHKDVEEMTFRTWSTSTIPRGFLARWTMLDLAWIQFTQDVLVPLFSAVCTAPENKVYDYPVEEFLDYIWLTLGHHHYVALNGVQEVVSKLIADVQHVHLSSPISNIQINPNDPTTSSITVSADDRTQIYNGFHHIIFATQAIHAVPLLESFASSLPPHAKAKRRAVEEQVACLRQFSYCSTLVINHTDPSLLPDDPQDKRDLNLIYPDRGLPPIVDQKELNSSETKDAWSLRCLPPSYTMATHVLLPPQGYPAHLPTIYQTTNPIVNPRESRILSVASLDRAVLTVQSKRALKGLNVEYGRKWWQAAGQGKSGLGPLQGARRGKELNQTPGLWICGSFAHSGIPLLEGCVVSARNVVEQGVWRSEGFQRHIPW